MRLTRIKTTALATALALACSTGVAWAAGSACDEEAPYDPYSLPGAGIEPAPFADNMAAEQHATENIGSWDLPDGSRILSTGKSSLPSRGFDPTMPSSADNYPIDVFPFVAPGAPYGPGPAPMPRGMR